MTAVHRRFPRRAPRALAGLLLGLALCASAAHAQWPGPPPPGGPPPPPPFDRIAHDLGIAPEKVRAAFHKIHPMPPDGPPTPAQRQADRKALATALHVSPARLAQVMDKYRPDPGPGGRDRGPGGGPGDGPPPPFGAEPRRGGGPGPAQGGPPPPQDEDHGRPVALVARDLGVTPEQFRAAFRKVHPAGAGQEPTAAQRRANRKILAETLHVSPERLDAVMDKYRPGGRGTNGPPPDGDGPPRP